jgi:hypothetical protein
MSMRILPFEMSIAGFRMTNAGIMLALATWAFPAPSLVAQNCTSEVSGNWLSASTWSCNAAPAAGDVIVIGTNTTVTISSNLSYTGSPMQVIVRGIWYFDGGGAKINLPCNSTVLVESGGQIIGTGGGNSQTVRICTETVWNSDFGGVAGPLYWPVWALPVELLSFDGNARDGRVQLTWATASEMGSSHFTIERSRDGVHWETTGSLAAAGTSQVIQEYSLEDAPPQAATWYYRLMQHDQDGSARAMGEIAVQVDGERNTLLCIQEEDRLLVHWPHVDPVSVQLTALSGVVQQPVFMLAESGVLQVDTRERTHGLKVLSVTDRRGERRSCRVVMPH